MSSSQMDKGNKTYAGRGLANGQVLARIGPLAVILSP
jgi:hypothetical protein